MSTIACQAARLPLIKRSNDAAPARALSVSCPVCRAEAGPLRANNDETELTCPDCRFAIKRVRGIWRAMAPARDDKFRRFVDEYQTVRLQEARGTGGVHYFLSLPYKD